MFRYIYPLNEKAKKLMKTGSTLNWSLNYPKDSSLEWLDATDAKNKIKIEQDIQFLLYNDLKLDYEMTKIVADPIFEFKLISNLKYNKVLDNVYVGIEDVRLFSHNDNILYSVGVSPLELQKPPNRD